MDWDDLRHVLALSRHRTMSRAGVALRTTHTTVARRIRALEERLGVRLFAQMPDGYEATAAGQDVVEVAERTEAELLALEARVLGRDAQLQGKLRVSTMDMLFRVYQPAFSSFTERYPGIELTVAAGDSEVSLPRREADVVLRMTSSPPEHLVGRKVGRIQFAVYASKALVERAGPQASYSDFPWIHWDERLDPRWLDAWLAANVPDARIAMRVDFSSMAIQEAIAAGVGAHFLACIAADGDPRLARVGPIDPAYDRDLWLLTLPEVRNVNRVRAFMDHMTEALSVCASTPQPYGAARR
ncbi:LysR family transcriptional regulator [Sorangium cellulosum]|uniref:LysR family transcriptional regulator n=1 Tax=Sorangium cellulosum TaxID=56 RepID=UPI000CF5314A|nr:LysR family transcriptional regulator [Sorangium cellulosum]